MRLFLRTESSKGDREDLFNCSFLPILSKKLIVYLLLASRKKFLPPSSRPTIHTAKLIRFLSSTPTHSLPINKFKMKHLAYKPNSVLPVT